MAETIYLLPTNVAMGTTVYYTNAQGQPTPVPAAGVALVCRQNKPKEGAQILVYAAGGTGTATLKLYAIHGGTRNGFARKFSDVAAGQRTQRLIANVQVVNGQLRMDKNLPRRQRCRFAESVNRKGKNDHCPKPKDSRRFKVMRTEKSATSIPTGNGHYAKPVLTDVPGLVLIHGSLHISISPGGR